ncbi:MAG: hypothetical protein M2R45_04613 [Verrucomicrobia subdivision 3 bacterium]|nr:hypothetical protein [Limisphaerales bacterium]
MADISIGEKALLISIIGPWRSEGGESPSGLASAASREGSSRTLTQSLWNPMAWEGDEEGQSAVTEGLSEMTAIAAGITYSVVISELIPLILGLSPVVRLHAG